MPTTTQRISIVIPYTWDMLDGHINVVDALDTEIGRQYVTHAEVDRAFKCAASADVLSQANVTAMGV